MKVMKIRDYSLPAGWYPRDPLEVSKEVSRWGSREAKGFSLKNTGDSAFSRAAIAPHAGWYYSGRIAAEAVSSLEPEAETVAVLGGHLPAGYEPLFAMEDAVRTPFGHLPIDIELRSALINELGGEEDRYRDNTVEVLLPMVHHFFPRAKLLWIRLSAEMGSFKAGQIISKTAVELNRKINVLASTDLTHYGRNYGFSPQGGGSDALRWVREVNDANFIRAVKNGDAQQALQCAERDRAACSVGAVLGAMGFAQETGLGNAQLLDYATSAEREESKEVPDSFVGYAAMAFPINHLHASMTEKS